MLEILKNEVSLTCLALIRVKLANAYKWIKFEAIEICLPFIRTPFWYIHTWESSFEMHRICLESNNVWFTE